MAKSEFKDRLKKTEEIELTVTGRASGDKSSRPVWFVEEDGKLYLLPVKGSDMSAAMALAAASIPLAE